MDRLNADVRWRSLSAPEYIFISRARFDFMIISEGSDCLWSFRSDVMIKGPELKHWYKYIFIYKDKNKIIITQPEK